MSEEELEMLKLADDKLEQLAMYMTQLAITQERTEGKIERLAQSHERTDAKIERLAESIDRFVESQQRFMEIQQDSLTEIKHTIQSQSENTLRLVGVIETLIQQR
jgi:DNA anti-recombination protein RmuC